MSQILVTQQLTVKDPSFLEKGIVIDPSDVQAVIEILRTFMKTGITIYDLTHSAKHKPGTIFTVNDHINRTGKNPLIGRQRALKVDFTDLTGLYARETGGVVTDCLGARFPGSSFEYPSTWLCNISIIARAMNFGEIAARLVNIHGD
ncbi:MAG: hypothetical protein GXO91_10475 [FCB group bacterium]|nr:hypothetical protein [FCB group bacterium]